MRLASESAKVRPSHRTLARLIQDDKDMRPDRLTVDRVRRFFMAARYLFGQEITIAWLAHTLVLVDGGPMVDAPRLGPALRTLGFKSVRRRRGDRRVSTWLLPGSSPPRVGRPSATRSAIKERNRAPNDELKIERI